jgi:hypothetical protein
VVEIAPAIATVIVDAVVIVAATVDSTAEETVALPGTVVQNPVAEDK